MESITTSPSFSSTFHHSMSNHSNESLSMNFDDYYDYTYYLSPKFATNLSTPTLKPISNLTTMALTTILTPLLNQTQSNVNDTVLSSVDGFRSSVGEMDDQNFNLFTDLATILTALFYGSAFILGTIGNGLIIYIVAHYQKMRTLSNVFLASLAIADLLLVCVCIPIKFVQLITYTWTFGLVMCKAIHYVQSLSAYCSVLTLTIISVERYYAIIHPVQCRATFSMRHIRKMICVTWILSAILASPSIGVYMLERIGDEYQTDHFWCVKIDSDWATSDPDLQQRWFEARVVYELYQILTILVLPTLVMIFTYSRICTHLWTVFHHRNAMRFGHACHFMSSCSVTTNTLAPTSSGIFTANTNTSSSIFTASMSSSTSTATTMTNVTNNQNTPHHNQRNSILQQDSVQECTLINNNLPPPPTPTSVISMQSLCSQSQTARRHSKQSNNICQHLKTSEEDNQTVKQVIKMLVAVVALFVLCWAPTLVIGLLRAFNIIAETNEGILREIITVTFLLSYLNSVINPIIYGFMSKNFRLYFCLIFNQFWSLMTTGHCRSTTAISNRNNNIDGHRHHHHHHHHHHHQQQQQQNNNHQTLNYYRQRPTPHRISSLNHIQGQQQQTEFQMQPNSADPSPYRKRQSWEFSSNMQPHPTTLVMMQQHQTQQLPPVMKKMKMANKNSQKSPATPTSIIQQQNFDLIQMISAKEENLANHQEPPLIQ